MHPQEILAQAQQGNPKVIAAILNHALKPRGIVAQVARRETCLYVLLQAIAIPPQAEAIALVSTLLRQLEAKPIETVAIHGQRTGDKSVAWRQEILLHAKSPTPPTFALDVTQTADPSPTNPVALTTDPLPPTPAAPAIVEPEAIQPVTLQANPWDEPATTSAAPMPASSATVTPGSELEAIAPAQSLQSLKLEEVLRRPEAVVLLLFVSMVILWQAYLDLTESDWEESDVALSSSALAKRLGVSRSTIYRRKNKADFSVWTQTLDPDGIAWMYVMPKFVPSLR
jgi:hypothetical protein